MQQSVACTNQKIYTDKYVVISGMHKPNKYRYRNAAISGMQKLETMCQKM